MTSQTRSGGPRCGAVRLDVEASLDQPMTCNCSRRERFGRTRVFAPRAAFTLRAGEGAGTEHRLAGETIARRFRSTCGVESFAFGTMPDGTKTVAIDADCLDRVDPRALEAHHHDGAAA